MTIRRLLTAVCLVVALAGLASGSSGAAAKTTTTGPVVVVHFNANINELGSRFLGGALHHAASENAQVVIVQLNTLGGAITSMQTMVGDIFASPVPVVVWVGPAGAGAASAGTFIAAAASYLAMAPATNIGAAAVVGSQGAEPVLDRGQEDNSVRGGADGLDRQARHRSSGAIAALKATIFKARAYSAEEAVRLGIANAEIRLWTAC